MAIFQTRLFFRIVRKSPEVYLLKIITLAFAFACSTRIILFSINEFGYDRFHTNHHSVFRMLKRNNQASYEGNRLSNRIPPEIFAALRKRAGDSILLSRVKVMNDLNIATGSGIFHNQRLYAADGEITDILSFDVVEGSLREYHQDEGTVIISVSTAQSIFASGNAAGRKLKIYTFGDTVHLSVAAVYKDQFSDPCHSAIGLRIKPGQTGPLH